MAVMAKMGLFTISFREQKYRDTREVSNSLKESETFGKATLQEATCKLIALNQQKQHQKTSNALQR